MFPKASRNSFRDSATLYSLWESGSAPASAAIAADSIVCSFSCTPSSASSAPSDRHGTAAIDPKTTDQSRYFPPEYCADTATLARPKSQVLRTAYFRKVERCPETRGIATSVKTCPGSRQVIRRIFWDGETNSSAAFSPSDRPEL